MVLRVDDPSESALRRREWRARRRAAWRQRCACCGAIFVPARSDARYCGAACNQKTYRRRKAAGEAPSPAHAAPWLALAPSRPPNPAPTPLAAPEPTRPAWRGGQIG
jgi:hypothetical protein